MCPSLDWLGVDYHISWTNFWGADQTVSEPTAFAQLLGFTSAWFTIGVVDDSVLAGLQVEWNKGQDDHPEHYRYWAFREFLAAHRPLAPELAARLFDLGSADPDRAMGGAIMADIIRLPECPAEVMDAALASDRPHLARIVERRSR
jgi:hypothetical protein